MVYCILFVGCRRRSADCYSIYENFSGAVWTVTASMHAAHALCGLLHHLCGLSHPLCMLHMRYVGCYWRCVGYCSLPACCTGAMWAVASSMWAVTCEDRERIKGKKALYSVVAIASL